LFLDARLAAGIAPQVADILMQEIGENPNLAEFQDLCDHFSRVP
jgi:glycerol-3-phosphate dehydrogenase